MKNFYIWIKYLFLRKRARNISKSLISNSLFALETKVFCINTSASEVIMVLFLYGFWNNSLMLLELYQVGQNLLQSRVTEGLFISTTELHQSCHYLLTPNNLFTIWTQQKKVRGERMRLLVSCRSGQAPGPWTPREKTSVPLSLCFAPYPD